MTTRLICTTMALLCICTPSAFCNAISSRHAARSMYYKSTDGDVHGPFHTSQIKMWYQQGYFPNDVPVSTCSSGPFQPIASSLLIELEDHMGINNSQHVDYELVESAADLKHEAGNSLEWSHDLDQGSIISAKGKWRSYLGLSDWRPLRLFTSPIKRNVNPLVIFYAQPHNDSVAKQTFLLMLVSLLLSGVEHTLLFNIATRLAAIVHKIYIQASVVKPYIVFGGSLDKGDSSAVLLEYLSRYLNSRFITVLMFYALLTRVANPIVNKLIQSHLVSWHMKMPLSLHWPESMKSKFNFDGEALHSAELLRSLLLSGLSIVSLVLLGIYLRSAAYITVAFLVSHRFYQLLHLPPKTRSASNTDTSSEIITSSDELATVMIRTQINSLENALFEHNTISAPVPLWLQLRKDIQTARLHAWSKYLSLSSTGGDSYSRYQVKRKLIWSLAALLFQIISISIASMLDIFRVVLPLGRKLIPWSYFSGFVKDWYLREFDNGVTCDISATKAAAVASFIDVVSHLLLTAILPILIWHTAMLKLTAAAYHVRCLDSMWYERSAFSETGVYPLSQKMNMDSDKWTTDGPDKTRGITFSHLTAVGSGRVKLRDLNVHIPSGKLTALIGGTSASEEMSSLLDVIWKGCDDTDDFAIQRGTMAIYGRDVKEWEKSTLKNKIVLLKDSDLKLPMKLDELCGFGLDNTMAGLERQRMAASLSGVAEIIKLFPEGIETDLGMYPKSILSADQWHKIYLCRALCHWDRDIIILDGIINRMSEGEEKQFLDAIKELIRPSQIVIITSARISSSGNADFALLFEKGFPVRAISSDRPSHGKQKVTLSR